MIFVFYKIFNIMILYWNIFYLYIFMVKLLFICLHRIK
nr:MAG TPA: Serine-rich and transmembrane domain-containing protein 1 [Caudoviricetes sp.]